MLATLMLDVISIGTAAEDVFVHLPQKNFKDGHFVFNPGSKVEIEEMEYFTGGSATNAGVAFARLGLKAGALCAVGEDEGGFAVKKNLAEEKVDAGNLYMLKGGKTAYSVILTGFGRDRVILHYAKGARLGDAKINFSKVKAKWFYLGSLHAQKKLLLEIMSHAKKIGAKIAFSPGQAELGLGIVELKKICGRIQVFQVNDEEALRLTGSADVERNLKKLSELAEYVVITRGKDGASATDGKMIYHAESLRIKPLDVTGAGDAFGSGFAAAIMKGKGIEKALEFGTANASSIIMYLGTKNILLSEAGIKKFVKKHGPFRLSKKKI